MKRYQKNKQKRTAKVMAFKRSVVRFCSIPKVQLLLVDRTFDVYFFARLAFFSQLALSSYDTNLSDHLSNIADGTAVMIASFHSSKSYWKLQQPFSIIEIVE